MMVLNTVLLKICSIRVRNQLVLMVQLESCYVIEHSSIEIELLSSTPVGLDRYYLSPSRQALDDLKGADTVTSLQVFGSSRLSKDNGFNMDGVPLQSHRKRQTSKVLNALQPSIMEPLCDPVVALIRVAQGPLDWEFDGLLVVFRMGALEFKSWMRTIVQSQNLIGIHTYTMEFGDH